MSFTKSANFVAASTQYFSAADSASLSVTGNLTIEGWFKFTTLPASGSSNNLIGKWQSANNLSYLVQIQNSAGTYMIRLINSSTGSNVGLATVNWTPSTGVWYHIGVVYTAATPQMELFINGVSQGTASGSLFTSISNNVSVLTIGIDGDLSSGGYLDGKAFLLRVWSTTRTGAQLSTNQCVLLGSTSNLAAEWSLDNVLTDNSGNSNTLTNVGSVAFSADIPSTCAVSLSTGNFLAFM